MKIVIFLFTLSLRSIDGRKPFRPPVGSIPFMAYYTSEYRGFCTGFLVSRTAVLTAAVCLTHPKTGEANTKPINVVMGASYRHVRNGHRVQVTHLVLPKLPDIPGFRGYLMEKYSALMILKKKVPDSMVEIPLRAADVDIKGEETLSLQEECLVPGWHFHYKGKDSVCFVGTYDADIVIRNALKYWTIHLDQHIGQETLYPPGARFLMQRYLRVQFLNVVKKHLWCGALTIKFQKNLADLGYDAFYKEGDNICIRDGMYGAPLICRGRVVATMMAPDGQWTNCTGGSNIFHLTSGNFQKSFMNCISQLFEPEFRVDMALLKKAIYEEHYQETYDYLPAIYDKLIFNSDESSGEF